MRSGARRVGAIALTLLLAACATHRGPRSSLPEIPPQVTGYSSICRARFWDEKGSRAGRLVIAFLPPDRTRWELLDPLGNTRMALLTSREGALLLDPPRRRFRRYASGVEACEALTGLRSRPDILAWLILGAEPARRELGCPPVEACPVSGLGEIRFLDEGGKAEWIPSTPSDPRWAVEWKGGDMLVSPEGKKPMLRLEIQQLVFEEPKASLFAQDPPAGFQPDEVEEGS